MSLVFGALVGQMVILSLLLLPLPLRVRSKILDVSEFLQNSTNFKVGIVFSTSLLALSLFDCVNRLRKFDNFGNQPYFTNFAQQMSGSLSYDQLATKFYTQRNLYINGAVLFLQVSIHTIIGILRKLVKKETEYRALNNIDKNEFNNEGEQIQQFKDLIKQKEIDIETFKKQINGLQKSYNDLNPEELKTNVEKKID